MTQHKQILSIGIQGKGSSTVSDINIIGALLKHDTDIILEPVFEDNMYIRLDLLRNRKIDLFYEDAHTVAVIECNELEMANRSQGPLEMQIVASAHSGAVGLMVRGDSSSIRTIYDICPETRIALPTGVGNMVYGVLAWLGLFKGALPENPAEAEWNVQIVPFKSWAESLRSIALDTADVALATPENPIVKETAASGPGVRFLDFPVSSDPEGEARFRTYLPYGQLIPAPEHGVREIWGITSWVGTACLWCRDDFDVELGYTITKWFDENYKRYKNKGNKLANYSRNALRQTLDVAMAPIHQGTVQYLKEIGLWREEDDVRMLYNKKLMDWYCTAWSEAVSQADALGIKICSDNDDWLKLWLDYKKKIGIPRYRQMTDKEIQEAIQQQ